jgi:hypothetical protein
MPTAKILDSLYTGEHSDGDRIVAAAAIPEYGTVNGGVADGPEAIN